MEGVAVFYKQGFGSTGGEGERKGLQGGVVMQGGFFRWVFMRVFMGFFGFFRVFSKPVFSGFYGFFDFLVFGRVFVNF